MIDRNGIFKRQTSTSSEILTVSAGESESTALIIIVIVTLVVLVAGAAGMLVDYLIIKKNIII